MADTWAAWSTSSPSRDRTSTTARAFEFIRNNYIDATNFFSTSPDTLHQNQFGGTFGGPIKRNKMFAFAAYQRWNADQSQVDHASHGAHGSEPDRRLVRHGRQPRCTGTQPVQLNQQADPAGRPAYRNNVGGKQIRVAADLQRAGAWHCRNICPCRIRPLDPNNCGFVCYAIPYSVTDNQFDTRVDYTISSRTQSSTAGTSSTATSSRRTSISHQHPDHHPIGKHSSACRPSRWAMPTPSRPTS